MDERTRRAAGVTGGMLDHALWYWRKGLSVLPLCWPESDDDGMSWRCGCGGCGQAGLAGEEGVGSRPLIDVQGLAGAVDEAQIRAWWTTWPEANIGLLLAPSGLLWVDVEGEEARREAQTLGMYLTRIVSTHRGFHYYYKKPEGGPVGRRTWQTEDGKIEISTEGYVVAPPSRHRLGERYLWRGERSTIQPPSWLVALLGQPSGPLREALGRDLPSLVPDKGAATGTTAAVSVDLPEPAEPWSIAESMLPPTTALSEELQIWEALGWITAEQLDVRCQVGQILHRWDRHGQGRGRGRLLWERWSECSSKEHLPAASQERLWQGFAAEETPGINEATASSLERLSALARQSRSGVVIVGKAVEQGCSRGDCGVLSRDDNRANSRDDSETMATTSSSSVPESSSSVPESSSSSGTGPLSLHPDSRQLAMDKDTIDLSEPEFVIMSALLSRHGKLVSFEQLADMLFHPDVLHQYANINENIRQLVCRIRNKLEQVGAERGWISNVRGLGYKLSLE